MLPASPIAVRIRVRGVVQGVVFRPFVYRPSRALGLCGWVRNDEAGVLIHAEGTALDLDRFFRQLRFDSPSAAVIEAIESAATVPDGATQFRILSSRHEDDGGSSRRRSGR